MNDLCFFKTELQQLIFYIITKSEIKLALSKSFIVISVSHSEHTHTQAALHCLADLVSLALFMAQQQKKQFGPKTRPMRL